MVVLGPSGAACRAAAAGSSGCLPGGNASPGAGITNDVIAFIGGVAAVTGIGTDAGVTKEGIAVAGGGIICAGALYLVLSLLAKLVGVERIKSFFPPVVTGPIIMVIGLSLAPLKRSQ